MQLASFSVSGFRALADVPDIPLRCPTVLTGRNDSGKSSTLAALAFLLDYAQPVESDFRSGTGTGEDATEISVTGEFELTESEREATGLPGQVRIRRVATRKESAWRTFYEVERKGPADPELRNLNAKNRQELERIAGRLGIEPVGDARYRDSFRQSLAEFAATQPSVMSWETAGSEVTERLPRFLQRTGIESADVTSTILGALKSAYREILDRDAFRKDVANLQAKTESALKEAAQELCAAIESGVDGLSDVEIIPQVSFKDPVSSAQLIATRHGHRSPLEQSGTGRHKQVVQAVWEWETKEVTKVGEHERSVVIAYDEPDTSLDYVRQRDFMDRARGQCTSGNVRMIIATHSVQIIDHVPLRDVIHLDRDCDGTVRISRLTQGRGTDPSLEAEADLTRFASDLAEQLGVSTSAILFERCFLLVEGPSEKQSFPRLFRLATEVGLREAGIVLLDANGNGSVLKLAEYLTAMHKPVHAIIDKDSLRDHKKIFSKENLKAHGIPEDHIEYLGDPNELEELFSDEQWCDMANGCWPRHDGDLWTPVDFTNQRADGKKFSKEISNMLSKGSRSPASKPDLISRIAERLTSRNDIPKALLTAFECLLAATNSPSDLEPAITTDRHNGPLLLRESCRLATCRPATRGWDVRLRLADPQRDLPDGQARPGAV